jgi:uncharacterized protein YecE (DUF72 family)
LIDQQIVKVGCCGFPIRQSEYYRLFPVVELQSTFYNLPEIRTAERWRQQAPSGFAFCMKAWQVITHPATSPTWRRIGKRNQPLSSSKYGHLRPTRQNFDAWERTLEICKTLNANVCVVQCPASFSFSRKNIENARRFLGQIDRGKTRLAWEPRGTWKDHPDQVRKLCRQLDLIHAVDILRSDPALKTKICYFRLHGLGSREFNYKYNYIMKDLERLREVTIRILDLGAKQLFILFNNLAMLENVKTFQKIMDGT